MKRFCIITNRVKDPGLKVSGRVKSLLEERGGFCYISDTVTGDSGRTQYTNSAVFPDGIEGAIVVGGDGTMIQAGRDLLALGIPLIGINLGTIGYLTEVEADDLESIADRLIEGDYTLEKRMMIQGSILRNGHVIFQDTALNDIVVSRKGTGHVIQFSISVNGKFLTAYKADGVLISTPTGSTAYNLSAGGPLVMPNESLMVMTPLCPHTLNARSVILNAQDVIDIRMDKYTGDVGCESMVTFDGSYFDHTEAGDSVRVVRSMYHTRLIRMYDNSFIETLRKKLN